MCVIITWDTFIFSLICMQIFIKWLLSRIYDDDDEKKCYFQPNFSIFTQILRNSTRLEGGKRSNHESRQKIMREIDFLETRCLSSVVACQNSIFHAFIKTTSIAHSISKHVWKIIMFKIAYRAHFSYFFA